eukprot:g3676.t1
MQGFKSIGLYVILVALALACISLADATNLGSGPSQEESKSEFDKLQKQYKEAMKQLVAAEEEYNIANEEVQEAYLQRKHTYATAKNWMKANKEVMKAQKDLSGKGVIRIDPINSNVYIPATGGTAVDASPLTHLLRNIKYAKEALEKHRNMDPSLRAKKAKKLTKKIQLAEKELAKYRGKRRIDPSASDYKPTQFEENRIKRIKKNKVKLIKYSSSIEELENKVNVLEKDAIIEKKKAKEKVEALKAKVEKMRNAREILKQKQKNNNEKKGKFKTAKKKVLQVGKSLARFLSSNTTFKVSGDEYSFEQNFLRGTSFTMAGENKNIIHAKETLSTQNCYTKTSKNEKVKCPRIISDFTARIHKFVIKDKRCGGKPCTIHEKGEADKKYMADKKTIKVDKKVWSDVVVDVGKYKERLEKCRDNIWEKKCDDEGRVNKDGWWRKTERKTYNLCKFRLLRDLYLQGIYSSTFYTNPSDNKVMKLNYNGETLKEMTEKRNRCMSSLDLLKGPVDDCKRENIKNTELCMKDVKYSDTIDKLARNASYKCQWFHMNVHPTFQAAKNVFPQYPRGCRHWKKLMSTCENNELGLFSKPGKCKDVYEKNSCENGKFYKGLCPGKANIMCCVPSESIKRRRLLSFLLSRNKRVATIPVPAERVEESKSSLLELEVSGLRDDWIEFTKYVNSSHPKDAPGWVLMDVNVTDSGEFSFRCSKAKGLCNAIYYVKNTGEEVQFLAGSISLNVFLNENGQVSYEACEDGACGSYGNVNEGDVEGALGSMRRRRLLQANSHGNC